MGAVAALRKAVLRASQQNRELTAAEFAAKSAVVGYGEAENIRFRIERAKLHRANSSDYLSTGYARFMPLLAAASMAAPARVLDFGGGFGHIGAWLRAVMPEGSLASYSIAELPEFAAAAERAGFSGYVSDFESGDYNVVHCSGTLLCLSEPIAMLERLVAMKPEYLVLVRNFFSTSGPRYFEQRSMMFDHGAGPIPAGFTNKVVNIYVQALPIDAVMRALDGYDIITRCEERSGMVFQDDGLFGEDLICRRKTPKP